MLSRINFNFINRLDARARIFVLVGVVVFVFVLIYFGTRWLSGGAQTTGPTRLANAPTGLVSVPGAQQTPEYQRTVEQINVARAQQAQMTGGTAVPTLINYGGQQANCVICADQVPNVKNLLDGWSTQGKVTSDVAADLQALADKNVTEAEYAGKLADLVRQGKLTPEQARQLLEEYRKQHAAKLLADSSKMMDGLIKSGQLPVDAANELLRAQRNNVSPSEYADILQRLVREGKISPETAARLLAQYTQQRAKEIIMRSIAILQEMSRNGQITPDVLKDLIELETNMVPVDAFSAVLDKNVKAGKLTPAVAAKILDEYKGQKAAIGPTQTLAKLLQQAEAAAYAEINDLLKAGKMSQEVASQLTHMIQTNVSLEDYKKTLTSLVQQKKITPEIAQLKYADYQAVKKLRDLTERLARLQGNNASAADYAAALKQAVQDGALTPEQAAQLMQEYQAVLSKGPRVAPTTAGTAEFAQLQQRVQAGAPTPAGAPATAAEFNVPPVEAITAPPAETDQQRLARIQALVGAMNQQAGQLINSWKMIPMKHVEGQAGREGGKAGTEKAGAAGESKTTTTTTTTTGAKGPVVIKAGSILFGILETTANSDFPNNPVMVTIVEGPFKGARLLGKLQTEKNVAGQLNRITLNFTLMNYCQWNASKSITAYAIDPDTARAALATSVDNHYFQRFGAIILTSLLQGYSQAIQSSSSTSTTGIFGTSSTHPTLTGSEKIWVAFGQIGQNLAATTQAWINIPPTVRIEAGVGLGILFTADVTAAA